MDSPYVLVVGKQDETARLECKDYTDARMTRDAFVNAGYWAEIVYMSDVDTIKDEDDGDTADCI